MSQHCPCNQLNGVLVDMRKSWMLVLMLFLSGCAGIPEGTTAVSDFDISCYTGKWYEIARLDHRFERGLSEITAEYTPADDGRIIVVNRGYEKASGTWKTATGKAYQVGEPTEGRLKVSFFGPFYGGYNVLKLDQQNYQYALVSGPSRSYLWILSRTPDMETSVLEELVNHASELGFDTESLIYVEHTR